MPTEKLPPETLVVDLGTPRPMDYNNKANTPTVALTEDLIKRACEIVGRGNFRTTAMQMLGVPRHAWSSWINRGRKEIRDFLDGKIEQVSMQAVLVQSLEKAESEVHSDIIRDVLLSDDIKAKLWYLERRYNKLYSRNPNAHVDDESGEDSPIDPVAMLAERLEELLNK